MSKYSERLQMEPDSVSHDDKVKAAARFTVCVFANDAAEAKELMLMLGIYPGQEDEQMPDTERMPMRQKRNTGRSYW